MHDDSGTDGVVRNPQNLLVEGRENGTLIEEEGHVQGSIALEGRFALLLYGVQEKFRIEEMSEIPEA
jgi:hypothetical protein